MFATVCQCVKVSPLSCDVARVTANNFVCVRAAFEAPPLKSGRSFVLCMNRAKLDAYLLLVLDLRLFYFISKLDGYLI